MVYGEFIRNNKVGLKMKPFTNEEVCRANYFHAKEYKLAGPPEGQVVKRNPSHYCFLLCTLLTYFDEKQEKICFLTLIIQAMSENVGSVCFMC